MSSSAFTRASMAAVALVLAATVGCAHYSGPVPAADIASPKGVTATSVLARRHLRRVLSSATLTVPPPC